MTMEVAETARGVAWMTMEGRAGGAPPRLPFSPALPPRQHSPRQALPVLLSSPPARCIDGRQEGSAGGQGWRAAWPDRSRSTPMKVPTTSRCCSMLLATSIVIPAPLLPPLLPSPPPPTAPRCSLRHLHRHPSIVIPEQHSDTPGTPLAPPSSSPRPLLPSPPPPTAPRCSLRHLQQHPCDPYRCLRHLHLHARDLSCRLRHLPQRPRDSARTSIIIPATPRAVSATSIVITATPRAYSATSIVIPATPRAPPSGVPSPTAWMPLRSGLLVRRP